MGESMTEAVRGVLGFGERDFDPSGLDTVLRVATTDEVISLLGPALLGRLGAEAPGVRLAFRPLTPSYNLSELELGQVDVVITVDWTAPPQLRRTRLFSDAFCCVVAPSHALAHGGLDAQQYAQQRHLLVAPLGGGWGPVDQALADQGLSRTVAVVVPVFSLVPRLLLDCPDLMCTLPRRVAESLFARDEVAWFEPPVALQPVRYDLFWHERTQTDVAHRWIRQILRELCSGPRPGVGSTHAGG